ncbi:TrmB family transcriptional regulator [Candidatus Woesearchaeota archaeon]|nr:TrmB family transcriptional regulator [Candidatus Woesearchaeota archaeon]
MIVKEEFLNKIKNSFELNIYEAKIWTALLSRGISTAGELSDISGVPRSRSYDVLESLERKSYIIMKLGKPIKYLAVEPSEIINRIRKNVKYDTERKLKTLEDIKTTDLFGELNLLHKQGISFIEPASLSGSLKGRNNIYDHLDSLLRNAEKSVVIVTTAKGLIRKNEALKKTLRKLKAKGVNIRIAAPVTKESSYAAESLAEVADVRNTKRVNARFAVVDNKNLLFMVMNDEDVHSAYDVGIWAETPFFASAIEGLFNVVWEKLEPMGEAVKKIKVTA